jgi:GT2 family glycosyltransferase
MKIAINILNWNGYEDTVECINSILSNKFKDFKIFLLDNGSKGDDYLKLKNKFKNKKNIRVLRSKKNLGFAGGHNYLCSKINLNQFEYVFLLNNDSILKFNFLLEINKSIEKTKNNSFQIYVPTIYYYNDKLKEQNIWNANDSKKITVEDELVKHPTGCAVIINSDLIKKYGLFRSEFFAYAEELEYFYRMKSKGIKMLYVPKAIMWHKVIEFKDSPFKVYMSSRNKWRYWSLMKPFDKVFYLLYLLGLSLPKKLVIYSREMENLKYFFKGNFDGLYWIFKKTKPKNPFIKNE